MPHSWDRHLPGGPQGHSKVVLPTKRIPGTSRRGTASPPSLRAGLNSFEITISRRRSKDKETLGSGASDESPEGLRRGQETVIANETTARFFVETRLGAHVRRGVGSILALVSCHGGECLYRVRTMLGAFAVFAALAT